MLATLLAFGVGEHFCAGAHVARLELEMAYAEKFDDVLPPNKVTRLFQAENKLETAMMMEIAKDVPLAK